MSLLPEERHKAIIIPVILQDKGPPKFLTVRDSRHQEWIFVTGGCKKSEIDNPLRCGLRELEEETRGTFNIKSGSFTEFEFKSTDRSPEELRKDRFEGFFVTLVYHVYIIVVEVSLEQQQQIKQNFHANLRKMELNKKDGARVKRAYDENDDLSFDTLEEFNRKKQWQLIKNNIIKNQKFYNALSSSNKQIFNIRSF